MLILKTIIDVHCALACVIKVCGYRKPSFYVLSRWSYLPLCYTLAWLSLARSTEQMLINICFKDYKRLKNTFHHFLCYDFVQKKKKSKFWERCCLMRILCDEANSYASLVRQRFMSPNLFPGVSRLLYFSSTYSEFRAAKALFTYVYIYIYIIFNLHLILYKCFGCDNEKAGIYISA